MIPHYSLPPIPNIVELEHDNREAALETWMTQAKGMKQEYLTRIETETGRVHKEYKRKKQELEEWYREKIEKFKVMSEKFTDQADDSMNYVKELLDLHRGGSKPSNSNNNNNNNDDNDGQRKPDATRLLHCPITGNLMVDPVFAADGHTYERSAIEHHFAQGGQSVPSPVTGKPLAHHHLVPNAAVQAMVSQYM